MIIIDVKLRFVDEILRHKETASAEKDEYKNMFTIQSQHQPITHSMSNKINILNQVDLEGILNLKETRYFSLLNTTEEIPKNC